LGAGRATPVLLQGPVVEIICETAQAIGADMIVLGSHGHTALYELLVGSVSEGVIRHARLPVTVVPAAGKAS
jgi:nucleotide-binding universal stress UspA family protein